MTTQKDYSWLWWIVIFGGMWLFGGCTGGPQYPGDQSYMEDAEMQAERLEFDTHPDYDPGENYVPEPDDRYDACDINGCPWDNDGVDCNIKGNITFAGEKIYHLPGQEFYAKTVIDPAYGERWFCTEEEARANGWRKAYQ